MFSRDLDRRAFVEALAALPFGAAMVSSQAPPPSVKVAAGSGRANDIIKLPGGGTVHVKVSTQDSGGAAPILNAQSETDTAQRKLDWYVRHLPGRSHMIRRGRL